MTLMAMTREGLAPVSEGILGVASRAWQVLAHVPDSAAFRSAAAAGRSAIRVLAEHSGVPALVVAAVLIVVGHRLIKRTARFAAEVALVSFVLAAAVEVGWIRW